RAGVDLDRKARRTLADLRHVDQLQPMLGRASAGADRGRASLDGLREEAVELGRRDSPEHAVAERNRLGQQAGHMTAGLRAGGHDAWTQSKLFRDPRALVIELLLPALV